MLTYLTISAISLGMELVGLLMYLSLFVFRFFTKLIHPSAYEIFALCCIVDVFTYVNSFLTTRIPLNAKKNWIFSKLMEFFPRYSNVLKERLLTTSHHFHFIFAHAQLLLNLTIMLIRFTLAFHRHFFRFWKKKTGWVVLGILIYSVLVTIPISMNESYFEYREDQDRYQLTTTTTRPFLYYPLGVTSLFVTIFNTILIIKTVRRIVLYRKETSSLPKYRLVMFGLISLIADYFLTTITVFNVWLTIFPTTSESDFLFQFSQNIPYIIPFASDSLTFTRPILFLLFNGNLRRMEAKTPRMAQPVNQTSKVTTVC